jgi:hypothetical protein
MLNFFPYTLIAPLGGYNGLGATMPGAWAVGNEEAETVDTLTNIYTGHFPTWRAPTITSVLGVQLNGQYGPQNIQLDAGKIYTASIAAADQNSPARPLGYQWMILPIPILPTDHTTYVPIGVNGATVNDPFAVGSPPFPSNSATCQFTAPSTPGQYRLAVWVYNDKGKFTTHNAPFTVAVGVNSAYVFPVASDTYVQGPWTSGSTPSNYASALATAGSYEWMLGNSFAKTLNITFFPYLYFNFSAAPFFPQPGNLPTQASLVIFQTAGTMPYYNVSAYPVQPGSLDGWNEASLAFAQLQNGMAATAYTYNAVYNWPYSPGYGGPSNCPLQAQLPAGVVACKPLVRPHPPCARAHARAC